MPPMVEPHTIGIAQLPAPPAGAAARGDRVPGRAADPAGIGFEAAIARGSNRGSASCENFGEGEPTHGGEALPPLPVFDPFFHEQPGGGAAPFMAQQIAQEMVADEYVAPEQQAASASGSYRSVPVSSVSYDGPIVPLDILV